MNEKIDIVFDGPPELVSGRFVEVEDARGSSISLGEWIHRPDGYWVLRIDDPREVGRLKARLAEEKTCKSSGIIYEEVVRLRAELTEARELRDKEYAFSVKRMQQVVDANSALVEDRDRLRVLLADKVLDTDGYSTWMRLANKAVTGQTRLAHAVRCGSRCTVDGRRGACTCGSSETFADIKQKYNDVVAEADRKWKERMTTSCNHTLCALAGVHVQPCVQACGIVPPRPTFPPNRVIKEGREAVSSPEGGK